MRQAFFTLSRYPSGHRLASPHCVVVVMAVCAKRVVHDGAKESNNLRISKICLTGVANLNTPVSPKAKFI
jgi:hypothetical protein